jgi:ParB family chromosome partitioning protein
MTDIVNIPLNKLTQFEGNVRKTQNKGFIDELAASIKAHGLQQNLVVKKEGKQFAVVAGSQRLTALLLLAKSGEIKGTHPVPCKLAQGDIDPTEISLLENVLRDDMHPADEFEAFRDLIDKGVPAADIAARFGVSETVVTQRLKLARVSPAVLKAYREERLTLQQVMAFAVSDDHAAQTHVLENLRPHDKSPSTIREALTENEIAASDRRVKFVTLKAYEKAGGTTRRDLFSEGEDSVFILDAALLDRLVTEKLERAAKSLAKEGWKWTVAKPAFDYDEKAKLRRVHAEPAPLPPKLAREAEALEKERDTLLDEYEAAGEDADEPARIEEIADRLDAIEDKRGEDVWTPAQVGMAGAVLTIGHDGKAQIERGLVRPEEWAARNGSSGPSEKATPAKTSGIGETETEGHQAPALSAALIESLTAQRSAALAAELQQRPDVALAAIVHAFASRLLRHGLADGSSLEVTASSQSLRRVEGSKAHQQIEAAREKWSRALPVEGDLWVWCLEQKQGVLLELLAFCAATTINAVQVKSDRSECGRLRHADRLTAALGLDMKAWFTADAANYFSRVSKPQILDAIKEAKQQPPAPAWEKLKKADLAQEAERQLSGSGWLPMLLRSPI